MSGGTVPASPSICHHALFPTAFDVSTALDPFQVANLTAKLLVQLPRNKAQLAFCRQGALIIRVFPSSTGRSYVDAYAIKQHGVRDCVVLIND
jgi:hypothetical protein